MARHLLRLLACALLAAAVAAQPCIECKDCRTDNCYRSCSNSCPQNNGWQGPIRPSDVQVNGDACRNSGTYFAPQAARDACETTRKYCQGGRSVGGPMRSVGPTNLAQCANIAMGACQSWANNPGSWGHPCGNDLRGGYQSCNSQTFRQFYEGETSDLCRDRAKSVTGVNPGTNQFINPILNLIGRRLFAA